VITHVGNHQKIISRSVSLGCSLSADPTSRIYSKGAPKILAGIGEGYRLTKALISLKRSNAAR